MSNRAIDHIAVRLAAPICTCPAIPTTLRLSFPYYFHRTEVLVRCTRCGASMRTDLAVVAHVAELIGASADGMTRPR